MGHQETRQETGKAVRSTLLTRHLKGPGDRRAFPSGRVGDRSVTQERRRLRDRLRDDRNAQNLFKGLLEKCND